MIQPDTPLELGDRVLMRKTHPCGSREWTVTRVGADIGLQCAGCGRRILLPRRDFAKNAKQIFSVSGSSRNEEE